MKSAARKKVFSIKSDSKFLQSLLKDKVSPFLNEAAFDEKTRETLLVALGEAITNSIRHSYHCNPDHTVRLSLEDDGAKVTFRIRDYGDPVDLERIKAKENPQLPPENPGGLGIYFMKTIMDEMSYNTGHSKGNELVLVKYKKGARREDSK